MLQISGILAKFMLAWTTNWSTDRQSTTVVEGRRSEKATRESTSLGEFLLLWDGREVRSNSGFYAPSREFDGWTTTMFSVHDDDAATSFQQQRTAAPHLAALVGQS